MKSTAADGPVRYSSEATVPPDLFVALLKSSGLAARRPVDDAECMRGMVEHASLTITAWSGDQLIGIARSVTDFHYCCYISDLAVDAGWQRQGVGRRLIEETRGRLGDRCRVLLIAAPAADTYYPRIGFESQPRVWTLPPRADSAPAA